MVSSNKKREKEICMCCGTGWVWEQNQEEKKEMSCIVLLSRCTRWPELFGQALLHVFRCQILQNVLFCVTSVLLNCSLCFLAGTRGQGQKDVAQSRTFPFPPESVSQDMVFESRDARDAKCFCSNILSLKCFFRHLLSYSLACTDWPDSATLIQMKFEILLQNMYILQLNFVMVTESTEYQRNGFGLLTIHVDYASIEPHICLDKGKPTFSSLLKICKSIKPLGQYNAFQ